MIPVVTSLLLSIFLLLLAPTFFNAYEIVSPVMHTEEGELLQLTVGPEEMVLSKSGALQSFRRMANGKFDLEEMREVLSSQGEEEKSIKLEPAGDLTYEEIVSIMDAINHSRKDGNFRILFGNLDK